MHFLASFLLVVCTVQGSDVRKQFADYVVNFSKGYVLGSDEYEHRFRIFIDGLERIKKDQKNSPDDVDRACLGKNVPPLDATNIPDSVDYRTHDPPVVTIVRDQHKPVYCGSCWAFSA